MAKKEEERVYIIKMNEGIMVLSKTSRIPKQEKEEILSQLSRSNKLQLIKA